MPVKRMQYKYFRINKKHYVVKTIRELFEIRKAWQEKLCN